jgi:hypothetical protein
MARDEEGVGNRINPCYLIEWLMSTRVFSEHGWMREISKASRMPLRTFDSDRGIPPSKYQYTDARSRQRASPNHTREEIECSVIS